MRLLSLFIDLILFVVMVIAMATVGLQLGQFISGLWG